MTIFKAGLTIGSSTIDRNGVFARRTFTPGEFVHEMSGVAASIFQVEQMYIQSAGGEGRISADGFQISDLEYFVLDDFSNSINHSCAPSCGITGSRKLFALRELREGDEVTYDYSTVEWTPRNYVKYDPLEWPMRCKCGGTNCRKLIVCFPYLPRAVQFEYLAQRAVPDFIRRKLSLPNDETRCLVCERALDMFSKGLR